MMSFKIKVFALFLCCVAGYSYISSLSQDMALSVSQQEYQANYFIEGSQTKRFTTEGKLESILNAKALEHYEDIHVTLFEKPHITVFSQKEDSGWIIHAEEGILNHDNNMILLEQQVTLMSSRPQDPIQSLKTSTLDLNYDTMIAHSSEWVKLTGQNLTLSGKGLFADLEEEHIYLQQEIKGVYENQ